MTPQRFGPGERVRVRSEERPGHIRTPSYVRGRMGRVESVLGEFRNPETLAYGETGLPERPLYKVSFRQVDLWEEYPGPADDELCMDIYEHWLEREESA
jgi:nitrile hydratase beta subunit-like protein